MSEIGGSRPQAQNSGMGLLQAKFMHGMALFRQGGFADAERIFEQVLHQQPDHFDAMHLLGIIACQSHRIGRGIELISNAIKLNANVADAHYNLGNALLDLMRPQEALESYERVIELKPNVTMSLSYAALYANRGKALMLLARPAEALASYDRALALKPDYAEAYCSRGTVLRELNRPEEALASYDKALALERDLVKAWLGRGHVLNRLKRHEVAADAYANVLRLDPQRSLMKGLILHQKMLSCEWKDVNYLIAEIERDLASGKLSAEPFGWQGVAKTERSLLLCAKLYNEKEFPASITNNNRLQYDHKRKVRVGYLSGRFGRQAVSHLLVGVLENHDDSRFEIYAFDNGWDDQSEIRQRINASVHNVVNISRLTDSLAIDAICENQIDILVNLNGYYGKRRTRVFAQRPAPIQISYLGYPGTLGANYIDYIIADRYVIPQSHKAFYTEKVVYLPNCYQANDGKKEIGAHYFSRKECDLPENGFVFCCFNNSYKIMPDVFDCWMRILKQVGGSVVWLMETNSAVANNLRKEAVARGVDPKRLIFAKRMPLLPDHLARHRLADLFLDTLPYNAHTTASDALWAGLPVLTCVGDTFPGKVAASMLHTIGLSELTTTTLDAYEQMAIDLANQPEKLAAMKRKVVHNRLTTPLFDTKLFTKHIEAAYTAMYERHQAGLAPEHIVIPN
jgi:predicted O-linked N-acetylglucosamine transferase (SPINDLY family)